MRLNKKARSRFWRYYGKESVTDSLTGLKTIGELKSKLMQPTDSEISLILFNIDGFGRINNAYGFEVGDEVLRQSAITLRNVLSDQAEVYYMMGDEFAVLPKKGQDNFDLAKSVLAFFENSTIDLEVIELRLSFCAGIAEGYGIDLLKKAAMALLEARSQGSGKILKYRSNSELENKIKQNFHWQNRLQDALQSNKLKPYYQPIANLKTGKVEKYECLIRIVENNKVISPMSFLDSAKESGLLSMITRTIMAQSFLVFKDNDYSFSVNITEDDLLDDAFVGFVAHKLEHHRINPARVYFEILEGIGASTVSDSLKSLQALRDMGCNISVDDFGIGYSNFHRMLELDVDIIKIDGSFIKNLDTSQTSEKIVSAIVGFAKAIDAKVIAEYVHSQEIYDIVKNMGIDYAQGYFIGEPRPEVE